MNKKEKISDVKVRIFNVVIQPTAKQCKDNYVALMDNIFNKQNKYQTGPRQFTRIISLSKSEPIYQGALVNYSVLDTEKPWYNEEKNELQQMSVDPNLNPDGKVWDFYFYPDFHRIAVPVRRGVSFTQVKKYLMLAFKDAAENLGFDDVVVNVVTSSEGIEAIFNLESIDRLSIEVSYSNNENFDVFDKAIEDEFRDENIGIMKVVADSPKNGVISLKKRSYLGSLIRFSKNNGNAKAKGHREGKVFRINTDEYPRVVTMKKVKESNILQKIKDAIESVL